MAAINGYTIDPKDRDEAEMRIFVPRRPGEDNTSLMRRLSVLFETALLAVADHQASRSDASTESETSAL